MITLAIVILLLVAVRVGYDIYCDLDRTIGWIMDRFPKKQDPYKLTISTK